MRSREQVARDEIAKEKRQELVQDQIEGYTEKIFEQIATDWIPGMAMNAGALGFDEEETDQMAIDMLGALRERIQDYRREIGQEAVSEGRFVRFPS